MKRITALVSDSPDGALHERARALFGRLGAQMLAAVCWTDRLRELMGSHDALKLLGRAVAITNEHFDYDKRAVKPDAALAGALT